MKNLQNIYGSRTMFRVVGRVSACLLLFGVVVSAATAQDSPNPSQNPSQNTTANTNKAALPPVSLILRDAPLRQALEQLFGMVSAQYSIAPEVSGFVTLRLTDQPFETALKLILRSSDTPLTYEVESGVYVVRVRPLAPAGIAKITNASPPNAELIAEPTSRFEVINLLHVDPYDLAPLLNIIQVPTGSRFDNAGGFGGFGGINFGGLGNGLLGGFGNTPNGGNRNSNNNANANRPNGFTSGNSTIVLTP
jgi:type II secretory pathway component GspD/PulD (secretin)